MVYGLGSAIALALGVSLSWAPPAGAAPDEPASAAETDDAELQRAKDLFERGRGKFETADYLAAIELWTEAYTALQWSAENGRTKSLLLYNIASARERAFEVTGDPSHLRQAKILLRNYATNLSAIHATEAEAAAEKTKVDERIADIDAMLAKAADDGDDEPPPKAESNPVKTEPTVDTAADRRKAKILIATGATLTGVGVAGLGMMAGGLAMGQSANDIDDLDPMDIDDRRDRFDRGRTGNALAIAGGVVGGTFVVVGVALLADGLVKRKRAKATALVPMLGPRVAGLGVRGRF